MKAPFFVPFKNEPLSVELNVFLFIVNFKI